MPGFDVGAIKSGDTVVISAAAGTIGSGRAALAEPIPRAKAEILKGGTHHLNIHRWRYVNQIMMSFLHNTGAILPPASAAKQ